MNNTLAALRTLINRDLAKLKSEIGAYQSESNLWKVQNGIANSGGNLCLHLIGNLNTFIGAELGETGYIRQRELEFSLKDVPKTELLQQIEATMAMADHTLSVLDEADMDKEYPLPVFKENATTGYFLWHLATHLTYHLGQINYHRRLLDFKPKTN